MSGVGPAVAPMPPELLVGVEVPATVANIGPGFDAFAVAVDRTLRAWTGAREARRVAVEGDGCAELPDGDDNLVWQALLTYCRWAGTEAPDVTLHTRSDIPLERGMGSSAAAAVAGVVLGRAVTGGGGSDYDLVRLVGGMEGHSDNAAAAMLGGIVVCHEGRPVHLDPTDRLRPVLAVPQTRQATRAARRLLPSSVPLADAAANGARAALLLAGLTGAAAFDPTVMTDVLHEPARLQVMTDSGRLVAALRRDGVAACLSGAGPSVFVVVDAGDDAAVEGVRSRAGPAWQVLPTAWNRGGAIVGARGGRVD